MLRRRTARCSGYPASAAPMHFCLPAGAEALRVDADSADVLRRTGGRPSSRSSSTRATIAARVRELGARSPRPIPTGDLLVLGLLKGSFIFLGDLVRQIERPAPGGLPGGQLATARARSSSGTSGCCTIRRPELDGKHILLVEDIIDTGTTLQRWWSCSRARQPRSLAICALAGQADAPPTRRRAPVRRVSRPRRRSWSGYGLDHAENYRHLPFIADLDSRWQTALPPRPPTPQLGEPEQESRALAPRGAAGARAVPDDEPAEQPDPGVHLHRVQPSARRRQRGRVSRCIDGKRLEGDFRTPVTQDGRTAKRLHRAPAGRQQRGHPQAARGRRRADLSPRSRRAGSPPSSSRRCPGS